MVQLASIFVCGVAAAAAVEVDVDTTKSTHDVNPLFMGCHSDSGYVQ